MNEAPKKIPKISFKERFERTSFGRFMTKVSAQIKCWSDAVWYENRKVDLSIKQDGSDIRSIRKKRPIAPIAGVLLVLLLIYLSCLTINVSRLKISWAGAIDIVASLFTPKRTSLVNWDNWWDYLWTKSVPLIWQTVEMCFIATVIGSLIAIPIYYLSARNVARNPFIYQPVRIVNDLIRTLPTLLLAVFAELIWGYSSLSGIMAMIVFSLGIMYQLMYEYIETLEMSPFEAIRSAGGSQLQSVHMSLHPEIKPMFFANFLYTFEINIRASVILGYVGAGGFGYEMEQRIEAEQYDRVGALLIPLFVLVCILQISTNIVSRKMR